MIRSSNPFFSVDYARIGDARNAFCTVAWRSEIWWKESDENVNWSIRSVVSVDLLRFSLTPEEINWHLLQLCLLRDYIDLEFRSVKVRRFILLWNDRFPSFLQEHLKFPYDLESIIDDWILMGYLVGNDFIPHLPHVHINQEALPLLWDTYKKVLPMLDGLWDMDDGSIDLHFCFQAIWTNPANWSYRVSKRI